MKVLCFRLCGEYYGIRVTLAREINRNAYITHTPLVPDDVRGLYNMRGKIVTVLDTACILGYDAYAYDAGAQLIILKNGNDAVDNYALLVDSAVDVYDLDESAISGVPVNVEERVRRMLLGVAQLNEIVADHDARTNRLLLIINDETLPYINGES